MVTVKLFGTLRLKTGCKSLKVDASTVSTVRQACDALAEATGFPSGEFRKCIIVINDAPTKLSAPLEDGDELTFFSPSGGG